jgi:hypothetical protein
MQPRKNSMQVYCCTNFIALALKWLVCALRLYSEFIAVANTMFTFCTFAGAGWQCKQRTAWRPQHVLKINYLLRIYIPQALIPANVEYKIAITQLIELVRSPIAKLRLEAEKVSPNTMLI